MPENSSDNPFRMFKITRETAERHWSDRHFSELDHNFYVACRNEPYKVGALVAAKFGDGWVLGRVKRKHSEILVGIWLGEGEDGWEQPAWFPRAEVFPVVGLQTSIR